MAQFCLWIVYQRVVTLNENVCNSVGFRRDFKGWKGISWVKLKWLFQVPERQGRRKNNSDWSQQAKIERRKWKYPTAGAGRVLNMHVLPWQNVPGWIGVGGWFLGSWNVDVPDWLEGSWFRSMCTIHSEGIWQESEVFDPCW